jgi:C_GCAxxG_C_C family probable redox protein
LAVAEAKGIQSEFIPTIATGFCSGIARTSNQCGALSGAILGISLLTGRSSPDESVEENYRLTQALISAFVKKFGSTHCRQLIQVDLASEEGQAEFKAQNKIADCLNFAEEATALAISILKDI